METTIYIGSAKLEDHVVEDGIVSYTLDNGLKQTATVDQFLAMCSPEPYDDGQVSLKKWGPTMEKIIQIAVDDGAQVQDWEWMQDRMSEIIGKKYMQAMAKAIGVAFPKQVTLKKVDEVLKA